MAYGEAEEVRAAARRRIGIAAVLAGGVAAVALLAGWIERQSIAEHFVDARLAGAGVPADYRIVTIGPFVERLESVRLGDPAAPDLVARSVELQLGYRLGGPYLKAAKIDGLRLSARAVDGKLSLGALDRLLPASSGKAAFRLPPIALALTDSRVRLMTPAGAVQSRIEGGGNLADGFDGRLSLAAPRLAIQGCAADHVTGALRIAVRAGRPELAGPIDLAGLACASQGVALGHGRATLDVRLGETLDRGRGGIALAGFGGRAGGGLFASVSGLITAAGDARQMLGTAGITVATPSAAVGRAASGMIGGAFRIVPPARAVSFAGDVALRGASLDQDQRRRLAEGAEALASTPVGPLARRAMAATGRLLADADADARLSFTLGSAAGSLIAVQRIAVSGRDGGFVRIEPADGLGWHARDKAWQLDGRLTSGGGNLPALDVRLTQAKPGDAVAGSIQLAPYQAGEARLALPLMRFALAKGQARFAGEAVLDGPIGAGRIEGLRVPLIGRVDRRGGFALGEGCTPVAFHRLSTGDMALQPARITLCGRGGAPLVSRAPGGAIQYGASASSVHLAGHSGAAPLVAAADRIDLSGQGVALRGLALRLGEGDALTRLDTATIDGRIEHGGVAGPFTGGSAQIAHVPLMLSDLDGQWRFANGALEVKGGIRVADADPSPRFAPLVAHDATLRVANGRITAAATLREPRRDTAITNVTIEHDLSRGSGHARIDVPGITFAPKQLQPEALTPLTLGVIANVAGTVAGEGRIDWSERGVTSGGRFHTDGVDLAAAFGPVTKVSGTIDFSDLLALATPPHQEARIAEVNPGIAVSNGVVHYQLLGDQRVKVEDAHWPFAGGDLNLEPTLLSFAQSAERHLTFRVKGLDAAAFVQQLAFPNMSATGTFDGVLPMIFDQSGGRIEHGELVARAGGGTVAYIGELSNAQVGTAGKLAFDALKAIRYHSLAIGLDGRLDGEIISSVNFDGVRQATGDQAMAARLIRGLPFRFNIRVRAPFRSLLGSARAFADPSILLQGGAPATVQPHDSETMR